MDNDEITKGYDPAIARRILGYARPYRGIFILAMLALLLVTASELLLPLVTQRAIDGNIMAEWLRVRSSAEAEARAAGVSVPEAPKRAGEWTYLPPSALAGVPAAAKASLRAAGTLEDGGRWYLFPKPAAGSPAAAVAARIETEYGSEWGAATKSAVASLPAGDAAVLRRADIDALGGAALAMMVLLAAMLVFNFLQTYASSVAGQRIMRDMRMQLFRKVIGQSLGFLGGQPVGRLVTRMTNDVETVNEFFTSVVVALMKDLFTMAGVLAALVALSFGLGAAAVLSVLPIAIVTVLAKDKARDAFRRQRLWVSKVNSYLSEHLSGAAVMRIFAQEERCQREFAAADEELKRANLGEMYVFATFRPLVDLFASITTAVVIWFGASLLGAGSLSLGVLIAAISLVGMFYEPVKDIAEKYTLLQSAMAGSERVFALLDTEERVQDSGGRAIPPGGVGVEFEDVRFSYKPGEEVIRGLSFRVEPGETVAVVGYTGAGKTTINNLLTRLWDVDSGEIRVNGVPVKEIALDELRAKVQPVLQEVFLFTGTIAENISLGKDMTRAEVEAAAKLVRAHDFISALPEGYDTKLSEGATNISTGQRQLLSFARAVAHGPELIVLDEATSSIDTETERLIQEAMAELLRGRTSIVIAHRLSTIRHADRILVMAGGRVVEQGSHGELLAKGGAYHSLYMMQYQDEASERAEA